MKNNNLVIWICCCVFLSGVAMDLDLKYFSLSLIVIAIILSSVCLLNYLDDGVKFQDVDKEKRHK